MEENPLKQLASKSTKMQRLSMLGRNDNWPEYPEEPSGDATLQALRKSWSPSLSPLSVQLLFPKGGMRSHEDAIKGCEIISRSVEYSRTEGDGSFILEQLDVILKWISCALYARDHTSGLRSLLSTIQLLFARLHELSYVMNDAEAIILLPYLLEKAGVAKTQVKDQFAQIISSLSSSQLVDLKRYGCNVCMRVVEKSKTPGVRMLAANECRSCVSATDINAIGKRGLIALAQAITVEKLPEPRKAYLDLFCVAAEAYGDLDKLLAIVGGKLTDQSRQMIEERCSKRVSLQPMQSPTRKSSVRTSSVSPWPLDQRLQNFRAERQTAGESAPRNSTGMRQAMPPLPPPGANGADVYTKTLADIERMVNGDASASTNGAEAVRKLLAALNSHSDPQLETLRRSIIADPNRCLESLTR